jgi:hypothetical protein
MVSGFMSPVRVDSGALIFFQCHSCELNLKECFRYNFDHKISTISIRKYNSDDKFVTSFSSLKLRQRILVCLTTVCYQPIFFLN